MNAIAIPSYDSYKLTNAEMANRLRQMGDVLESFDFLNIYDINHQGFSLHCYGENETAAETIANRARALRTHQHALKVPSEKNYNGDAFSLTVFFETFKIVLSANRESVCTKKVIGTETVEVPDYSQTPKKTITRDIVEWECSPVLND